MGSLRLARAVTGRVAKWIVLACWLVVLPFAGYFGSQLVDEQQNDISAWLPETAESTEALAVVNRFQETDALPTVVVYERPGGLTPEDRTAIEEDVAALAELDSVAEAEGRPAVAGPIPSEDGVVAQTVVTLAVDEAAAERLPALVDEVRDVAAEGLPDGANVYVSGAGGQAADSASAFEGLDSTLLLAALGVVVVLLLLAYRSPVLWMLPVASALTALLAAQALVYLLVRVADLTVSGMTYGILSVLVIGASVDYALLLVARYREELRRHEDRHEAMAVALHRASPAIVASGLTVALGMLCLVFADMSSTAGIGPVAAVGVVCGVLVMLTLLPALLVIAGRWVFWPLRPAYGSREPTESGFWARAGRRIARSPRPVWVTGAGVLLVLGLVVLRIDTSGLSTEESYTQEVESAVGERVLAEHGLVDDSEPAQVVTTAAAASSVAVAMSDVEGLTDPAEPRVFGEVAILEAALTDDPTTPSAFETIERLREAVHAVPGAEAKVTGTSALQLDITEASERDNLVIIPLVLLVVLLVLIGLLRSLVAPLLLMVTVVLSFGAAMGLSWLIFEFVLDHPAMNAASPLYIFVFLVALGIDYNIFLMTRVREETAVHGTRDASLVALAATGGVITSAGLVLAGTFAVLVTMPLVDFVQIGIAIALGIILDTFIVRSVLVTALNLDLGGRIWWPSGLDRRPPVTPAGQPAPAGNRRT